MIKNIVKRNGTTEAFASHKIETAITKTFLAVEGSEAASSSRVRDLVAKLTNDVVEALSPRTNNGYIQIESVQDQVELALMRAGEREVARAYVLYREEHAKQRDAEQQEELHPTIQVEQTDGSLEPLDVQGFRELVVDACRDLEYVDSEAILEEAIKNLYDGVTLAGVYSSLVMASRAMVEKEPNYSKVTARLLLLSIRREVIGYLSGQEKHISSEDMATVYPEHFEDYIQTGIELGRLNPDLADFDLDTLANVLDASRDLQFTYLSIQTLYDRYFLHDNEVRYELPQYMFMRVAMGLALGEEDREAKAIEFYQLLSSFDYMTSTPTLFNSGTIRSQLSSCYLTTVPDDLDGIYNAIHDNALLSKWAGGLGNDWTPVRAMGARIHGTNGKSQGVVPFLKVVNDTAVAVNQGGKRKGAVCAYLESWHLDIEEFLDLRKNTGDDRRRTHDMNTANWIPDLFMERVMEEGQWTLFSPSDCPDLHDLYGNDFREAYEAYEAKTQTGEIENFKVVQAKDLWRKMLSMLFETGHPWITFKDVCNLRSPQQHVGVVHSSNLCTEITLNTSEDEIAVCNLGSVNLAAHIRKDGTIDHERLRRTVTTAVRMLDNVVDINYYAVPQAKRSNLRHRPVGLGMMGFQDALYKKDISYASEEAVEFADESMELISYYAIEASMGLADERGAYETFEGSLWSEGILPIDSQRTLAKHRGEKYIKLNEEERLNWNYLRGEVKRRGMRNSNVMAIAPTATISNICGVTQSIEPTYQNLFVKSNLSGEFTVVNEFLVRDLKDLGLWDEVMINDLKYFDGSVSEIDRIPDHLKTKYATAFEVEPRWLVEAAARRQKWIDQAQSLNLYIKGVSGKKLDVTYRMAWLCGLKTTYYLRAIGATSVEKSTVSKGTLNAVGKETPSAPAPAPEPKGVADYLTPGAAPTKMPSQADLDELGCEACQ